MPRDRRWTAFQSSPRASRKWIPPLPLGPPPRAAFPVTTEQFPPLPPASALLLDSPPTSPPTLTAPLLLPDPPPHNARSSPLVKERRLPDPLPLMKQTFVHELLLDEVKDGGHLSLQTRSDLGFDPFLYQVRNPMCFVPGNDQFLALGYRLYDLANKNWQDLYRAVFFEQLDELLGPEFHWVQLPKTKSNANTGAGW